MQNRKSFAEVMGIINVTPDSFSDGGQHQHLDAALRRCDEMVTAGADWVDIGGESTRPGASAVDESAELDRVVPVIEAIATRFAVKISVDTSKAEVMRQAVAAGAQMINDVRALREEGALQAAAEGHARVCLMHMQGQPRSMQRAPDYSDVVSEVKDFLQQRILACEAAGIDRTRLLLDPGFGFGKTVQHNYHLLQRLPAFIEFGLPILVGLSRKSMIGAVTQTTVEQRLAGSIAGATIAAMKGAQIIRVHDVKETVDAVKVVQATLTGEF